MLFTGGLLLSAGATLAVAVVDKVCAELGIHWLGTAIKLIVPLAGLGAAIYFLENNPLLWWLK